MTNDPLEPRQESEDEQHGEAVTILRNIQVFPVQAIIRLEQRSKTLRISDAGCRFINYRRSRTSHKRGLCREAPGNDQACDGSFSVIPRHLQWRSDPAIRQCAL